MSAASSRRTGLEGKGVPMTSCFLSEWGRSVIADCRGTRGCRNQQYTVKGLGFGGRVVWLCPSGRFQGS